LIRVKARATAPRRGANLNQFKDGPLRESDDGSQVPRLPTGFSQDTTRWFVSVKEAP
jgi:hypothetical protein